MTKMVIMLICIICTIKLLFYVFVFFRRVVEYALYCILKRDGPVIPVLWPVKKMKFATLDLNLG